MKTNQLFLLLFSLILLCYGQVNAQDANQKRLALVMGNADYAQPELKLTNPINDANDMKLALENLGFVVDILLDGTKSQMEDAIIAFTNKAVNYPNSIRIIYYSGHAVQLDNNYLMSAKARFATENDIKNESVNVQECLSKLNGVSGSNYLILDACRSLPPNGIAFSNISGAPRGMGITSLNKPSQTLIAYATSSGKTSSDNNAGGRNGLYTQELLKNIAIPCQRLDDIFTITATSVTKLSNGGQTPEKIDNALPKLVLLEGNCGDKEDKDENNCAETEAFKYSLEEVQKLFTLARESNGSITIWDTVITACRDMQQICDGNKQAANFITEAKKEKDIAILTKKLVALNSDCEKLMQAQKWTDATIKLNELLGKCKEASQKYSDRITNQPKEADIQANITLCENNARRFSELKEEAHNFFVKKQWDDAIKSYSEALEYQKADENCTTMIERAKQEKEWEGYERVYNKYIEEADAEKAAQWWGDALKLYEKAAEMARKMDPDRMKLPIQTCSAKIELCRDKVAEFLKTPTIPKLVSIEGGKFKMGNEAKDTTLMNEKPAHAVLLSSFEMGKYEISNAEYCFFLNSMPNAKLDKDKWIKLQLLNKSTAGNFYERSRIFLVNDSFVVEKLFENSPVLGIRWEGAKTYCDWLSRKTGFAYSLPTEAQWEYSAKKAKGKEETHQYPWGNDFYPESKIAVSNLADEEHRKILSLAKGQYVLKYNDSHSYTCAVSSFPANEFGLHNLAGNVWEWCEDWYGEYNNEAIKNPRGPEGTGLKVIRGGSFSSTLNEARSSYRKGVDPVEPQMPLIEIGFRIVKNTN